MAQPSPNQQRDISLLVRLVFLGGLGWWLSRHQLSPYAPELHVLLWWSGIVVIGVGLLRMVPGAINEIRNFERYLQAARGYDATGGTACWLSEKEAKHAHFHKRTRGSRFLGTLGSVPLWLYTETHHLILGPAGSQKSTAAIANVLMGNKESALINDIKGELYETTAEHRRKKYGHRIVKIDPKDPENSAKLNLLDFIAAFVFEDLSEALTLVRGMVLQLYPEPSGGNDQNKFFRDGARILLVTVILAVIIACPKKARNMATVYRALGDMEVLHSLLESAVTSTLLKGEISDMAESAHASAFGDGGAARTFEQFRLGAMQAVEAFGPGNYLAAITSETDFSFAELKSKRISAYIVIDYANKDVLGKFSGLMQWLATYQLVAAGNNTPVLFVLDEFCNAPLHTLPTALTLLRSYGVKCVLATQDLDDIPRVYGSKHALETVLSETSIKQFLGGIRSQTTLEYLSKYLGEFSDFGSSFSFAKDGVQESANRIKRRLLTEDEIRRMNTGAQIIICDNYKPILASKVQVFAIAPWRRKLGINSLYGKKRKYLRVEVKIGWFRTKVTPYGIKQKPWARESRSSLLSCFLYYFLPRLVPSPQALILAALLYGAWEYGFLSLLL